MAQREASRQRGIARRQVGVGADMGFLGLFEEDLQAPFGDLLVVSSPCHESF